MLWFTLWSLLVLATLGGAFWLGWSLWRRFRAVGRELRHAGEEMAAMAERVERLTAAAAAEPATHDLFGDRDEHRAHLRELRDQRSARAELRRERHARTRAGWRAYTR